jgi:diguanylate cyclase (GGDEF)-like protein
MKFVPRGIVTYISTTLLAVCLLLGMMPSSHAEPAPRLEQLKQEINADKSREVALLKEALSAEKGVARDERLWVLVQLSKASKRAKKSEEALSYLRQAQKEAGSLQLGQVYVTRHLIQVLSDMDKRQEALVEFSKIAPMLPTLAGTLAGLDPQIEAAEGWLAGGTLLSSLGQLPEAMELLVRGMTIFDAREGQVKGQAESLSQIANLYYKGGDVKGALRDLQRAIDIAERDKALDILARLYMRKSVFLSGTGDVEAQYRALIRARTLALADENTFNLAVIATNLADIALQRKDYPGTLRFVAEAIPLVEKSGDRESLLICWINQGLALNRLGKPEGLELIKKAIDEFTITPGKKNIAADVQGSLAEELAYNGAFEKAYLAAVDFKKRTDEVRQASDQKRIVDSAARYQADKKQRQIEMLEQEQHAQRRMQWLSALAAGLGLLTAAILVISRIYLKRAYRKVEEMSLSDPLTGLRNRRYLASRIDGDLAQAGRQRLTNERTHGAIGGANTDIVFIMLDMDHFKAVNDEHGHAAGDAVLKQFSAILMQELRDADTVVRWGGEEFLIVAKQASCADIHLLAERVRARVAAYDFDIGNGTVLHKTCSIGFASYPFNLHQQPQPRWEDVVALADQCLYAAKASGRDMWVGIVPAGGVESMPERGDVRLGLRDGVVRLEHSAGREVVWPETHAEPVAFDHEANALAA